MRHRSLCSTIAVLAAALMLAACGGDESDTADTTTTETTTTETTITETTTTDTTTQPTPTGAFSSGEASVTVRGDVEAEFTAPIDIGESVYNEEDSEHDLLFLAKDGNALRVTVQAPEGVDEEPFIAVGLPGTSLFDENYFPDAFNTRCEVKLTTATPTAIEGSFRCNDLERGDAEQTIDAIGTFSASE
jgi:hypothetical protein